MVHYLLGLGISGRKKGGRALVPVCLAFRNAISGESETEEPASRGHLPPPHHAVDCLRVLGSDLGWVTMRVTMGGRFQGVERCGSGGVAGVGVWWWKIRPKSSIFDQSFHLHHSSHPYSLPTPHPSLLFLGFIFIFIYSLFPSLIIPDCPL